MRERARRSSGGSEGFSLLELAVVLGVLALLAGLLLPGVSASLRDGRCARVVELYEHLARAAQAHFADTQRLPIELGTAGDPAPSAHQLAFAQTYPGWDGPYLPAPVTPGANPAGDRVLLLDRTDAPVYATGPFDLLGDGTLVGGSASVLVLPAIEEALARRVDSAIDRSVPGSWDASGRVEYAGGDLRILVFNPPASVLQTPPPPVGGLGQPPDWWAQWWALKGTSGGSAAPPPPGPGQGAKGKGKAKGKDKQDSGDGKPGKSG